MFYRVSRSYCFNIQPIIPRKSFRDGYTIHAIQPLHATWRAILQRESGPLVFFRAIQTPATQTKHAKYAHYCVQYRAQLFQRCMDTQCNLAIACNMRTIYCTVYPGPNYFFYRIIRTKPKQTKHAKHAQYRSQYRPKRFQRWIQDAIQPLPATFRAILHCVSEPFGLLERYQRRSNMLGTRGNILL